MRFQLSFVSIIILMSIQMYIVFFLLIVIMRFVIAFFSNNIFSKYFVFLKYWG